MQRYLALDAIKAGDIILTASPTMTSYAIRAASFSRVSHAAIAIHPLIWFEALGDGVQYTIHEPTFVLSGDRVRFGLSVAPGERYIVKRPQINGPQDDLQEYQTAKALIEASSKYAFLNYALRSKFLQLARFGLGEASFTQTRGDKYGCLQKQAISRTILLMACG